QHLAAVDFSSAKLIQQFNRFRRGHGVKMAGPPGFGSSNSRAVPGRGASQHCPGPRTVPRTVPIRKPVCPPRRIAKIRAFVACDAPRTGTVRGPAGQCQANSVAGATEEGSRETCRLGMAVVMMMPEEALAILEQIPDDDHVDHENAEDNPGKALATHAVQQFIHLDWDEKGRFADGQPAGPA